MLRYPGWYTGLCPGGIHTDETYKYYTCNIYNYIYTYNTEQAANILRVSKNFTDDKLQNLYRRVAMNIC